MNAMNDIAVIKTVTGTTKNSNGFRTDTFAEKQVYCDVKSVTYSEFYAAYGVNLKVVKRIVIDVRDYESCIKTVGTKRIKPTIVKLRGDEYTIVRMYQTNDSLCELSLSEIE